MLNNDVLRSIRYILNVSDAKLIEIIELAGYLVTESEIVAYLKHEDEAGFELCPDEVMGHFLDGLITFKRGKSEVHPPQPVAVRISNSVILKKIRVAFQLKDSDLITLIEKSETLKITPSEVSAFFRRPDHRNYRECGDQYLRNVLRGLTP